VRVTVGERFSPFHVLQPGSGDHPAFYPTGTGVVSSGVTRPGREADYSPQTSAEVRNSWIYTSAPP
jgi:hypothetical protein